jgi:hypothetical protein
MARPHLLDIDRAKLNPLLFQPEQERACKQITRFIQALRGAKSDADYVDIQLRLREELLRAQKELMNARRNMNRSERGKAVPPPMMTSWADDEQLWERIEKQYRAVGDAIVWSRVGFDRRYILAYSRNADPGPFAARLVGADAELDRVRQLWKDRREFAILHDLTNCVRIADITVFTQKGAYVDDVKRSGRKSRRAQLKRMNDAFEFLMGRGPLRDPQGDMWEFVSSAQFKTRFSDLNSALAEADEKSATTRYLSNGWVIDCVVGAHLQPMPEGSTKEARGDAFMQRKTRTYARAGLDKAIHLLKVRAWGYLAVSPALAPPTIYPLDPWMCALLTCDLAGYVSVMNWHVLADAFRREGFVVGPCPLRSSNDSMTANDVVLNAGYRGGHLQIAAQVYSQMAMELVDPGRYASAMREAAERGPRGRGLLTFANERAVWR